MTQRLLDDVRLCTAIQGVTGVRMSHPVRTRRLTTNPFRGRLHNTKDLLPGEVAVFLPTGKDGIIRPGILMQCNEILPGAITQ